MTFLGYRVPLGLTLTLASVIFERKWCPLAGDLRTAVSEACDDLSCIPATELFPDLADPKRTPGIALRGVRLRMGFTQKEMAEKIGVTQGDLSKMEKGERAIGKKLATRIRKALKIDYRRFL